jgi:hypothetical protein
MGDRRNFLGILLGWQKYPKRRSDASRTVDLDEAPATAHNALDASQAQTAARERGREKGIEDPCQRRLVHAGAIIRYFQADKPPGLGIELRRVLSDRFQRHLELLGGELAIEPNLLTPEERLPGNGQPPWPG